tara:strand:+ start:2569 stop:2892 length:324 start_codon:yes stop_codon:yes gene_type:complete
MELNNIMLVTLLNGDELICNVSKHIEVVDGLEQEVCYKFIYPFVVDEHDGKLTFTPWKKWSRDTEYLISYDIIVNICAVWPNMEREFATAANNYVKVLDSMNYVSQP